MKKVLILGGSSYVGKHLVGRLSKGRFISTYNKSKIPNGIKFNSTTMNIVVRSTDNLEHELTIKFKLPYVNDQLIYKDNKNKSKGYILKDGSYSKKLRIGSLKKN